MEVLKVYETSYDGCGNGLLSNKSGFMRRGEFSPSTCILYEEVYSFTWKF